MGYNVNKITHVGTDITLFSSTDEENFILHRK